MIASKMKSPLQTNAIDRVSESCAKVSLGLTLAGIVTAILCVLALLHDTYSAESGRLLRLFESFSNSGDSAYTSASALVSSLGDMVILFATSFNQ